MIKSLIPLAMMAAFLVSGSSEANNPSYIPSSMTLREGGHEVLSRFSYWESVKSVNHNGELVEFSEGELYNQMDLDLTGRYGFTDKLQLSLGVRLRRNSSTQLKEDPVTSEERLYSFARSGLKSGLVQIKYALPFQDNWQMSLEANYEPSFFTNELAPAGEPQDITLGDDGKSVSFGMAGTYFFKSQNFISGKVLYRNPSENLSSEIFSEVEGVLSWRGFSLLAGFENNYSLEQDAYTRDPENKPAINNGNTFLYNSVNRSWSAPYAGVNFAFGKSWRLEARVESRISGNSTDLGNRYSIALASRQSKSKAFAQKYSAFKEYTVEANVSKITKGKSSVIIDAGMIQGLTQGGRIDFYHFDYLGGNDLIASGYVVKLGANKSLVKITKRYSKKHVEEGTLARGGLIRE